MAATKLVVEGQGRSVTIPQACLGQARVARFTFADLCDQPLGSADYLAISQAFPTIFITGVPQLDAESLPQARRLITLVDALYEHRVKTVWMAAAAPEKLLDTSNIGGVKDEAFAFDRTVSRLIEMQSASYQESPHRGSGSLPTLAGASMIADNDEQEEPFLLRFESQLLSDADIHAIWLEFDADGDKTLDYEELTLMLQSLSEIRNGHRFVPQELVKATWKELDVDGDGGVSYREFQRYMREYGLQVDFVP